MQLDKDKNITKCVPILVDLDGTRVNHGELLTRRALREPNSLAEPMVLVAEDGNAFDFNATFTVRRLESSGRRDLQAGSSETRRVVDTHMLKRYSRLRTILIVLGSLLFVGIVYPVPATSNSTIAGLIVYGVPVMILILYGVYFLTMKVRHVPTLLVGGQADAGLMTLRIARWTSPFAKVVEVAFEPVGVLVVSAIQGEPAREIVSAGGAQADRLDESKVRYCFLVIGSMGEFFLLAAAGELTVLHHQIRQSMIMSELNIAADNLVDRSNEVVILAP